MDPRRNKYFVSDISQSFPWTKIWCRQGIKLYNVTATICLGLQPEFGEIHQHAINLNAHLAGDWDPELSAY